MARATDPSRRLQRRLALHQALHDPMREPRNRLPMLPVVRRWQAWRLEESFRAFLADPRRAPAARFFLGDVYGDHDFRRRDADIARVLPTMQRLLPASLLETVASAIELGAITHAFDLRMAEALQMDARAPARDIDAVRYAAAYRTVGRPRLRMQQVALVREVGDGLAAALRLPGLHLLLRLSRGPAHAAGLGELQGFLERGVEAFAGLWDAAGFLAAIERGESEVSRRLFAGVADPFAFEGSPR